MNTVRTKLETANKTYLTNTWQGVGEELNGATLYSGHANSTIATEDRIHICAGVLAGPHARQGNYEVELNFVVITNRRPQSGDAEDTLVTHEKRCEAIAGIYGETRVATITAALTGIDAELGVSSYWGYDRTDQDDEENYVTILTKTFACHLV
jgi:hypothetical protein